jgi:hypothetical protein
LVIIGALVAGRRVLRRLRPAVTALGEEVASESKVTRQTAQALLAAGKQAIAELRHDLRPHGRRPPARTVRPSAYGMTSLIPV